MVDRDVGALTGVPSPPAHLHLPAAHAGRVSRTSSSVSAASVARTLSFTRGAKFTRGESMTLEDAHQVLDESAHAYAGSLKFAAVQLILGQRLSAVDSTPEAPSPTPPPPPAMPPNLEPCTITPARVAFDPNVHEFPTTPDETHSYSRLITKSITKPRAHRREDSTLESESSPNLTLRVPDGSPRQSDHVRRTRTESPGGVYLSHEPRAMMPRKSPSFSIRTHNRSRASTSEPRYTAREHLSRVRALLTSFRKRTNREDNHANEDTTSDHETSQTWNIARNFSFRNKRPTTATTVDDQTRTRKFSFRNKPTNHDQIEINDNNANENDNQPRAWAKALSFGSKNKRARLPTNNSNTPTTMSANAKKTQSRNEGVNDCEIELAYDNNPNPMQSQIEPPAYTPPREPNRSRAKPPKQPRDNRKVRMPGSGTVLTVDTLPIESAGRPDRLCNRDRNTERGRRRNSNATHQTTTRERMIVVS